MTRRRRWLAGASVLLAAAAVTLAVVAGEAVGDTLPGWEPEAGVLGSILFHDANGTPVTGGDLSAHPAAYFSVASGPGRDGDTKAQLKVFTPQVGVLPALWSGDTLTGATGYPDPAAPADIAGLDVPVAAGTTGDLSIADYIDEFPNNLTQPGYAGLYELRLYTSAPGRTQNTAYFRTDIRVTILGQAGGEVTGVWDVVYPGTGGATPSPTPTSTPTTGPTGPAGGGPVVTDTGLAVDPNGTGPIGAAVTLTATVNPEGVAGTVEIHDGRSDLGGAAYTPTTGEATLTLAPVEGTHVYVADFRPADPGSFAGSESVSVPYHAVDTVTKITITLVAAPSTTVAAGATGMGQFLLAAAVTPTGAPGSVHFFAGATDLGAGSYNPGIGLATVKVAAGPGTTVYSAAFTPADPTAYAANSTPPLTYTVGPAAVVPAPPVVPTQVPVPVPTHPPVVVVPLPSTGASTPGTPPVPTPTVGAASPTATTSDVAVATPTSIGGPLTLASRSTSLTAFIGLWVLLAAAALGAFLSIMRRNRRRDLLD